MGRDHLGAIHQLEETGYGEIGGREDKRVLVLGKPGVEENRDNGRAQQNEREGRHRHEAGSQHETGPTGLADSLRVSASIGDAHAHGGGNAQAQGDHEGQ